MNNHDDQWSLTIKDDGDDMEKSIKTCSQLERTLTSSKCDTAAAAAIMIKKLFRRGTEIPSKRNQ